MCRSSRHYIIGFIRVMKQFQYNFASLCYSQNKIFRQIYKKNRQQKTKQLFILLNLQYCQYIKQNTFNFMNNGVHFDTTYIKKLSMGISNLAYSQAFNLIAYFSKICLKHFRPRLSSNRGIACIARLEKQLHILLLAANSFWSNHPPAPR